MRKLTVLAVVLVAWAVVFFVSGVFCAVYETEEWRHINDEWDSSESYYRRPYSDLAGLLFFVSVLLLVLGLFALWCRKER